MKQLSLTFALVIVIAMSVTALSRASGPLFVSYFTSSTVDRFDDTTGLPIGTQPFASGINAAEGLACLMGVPGAHPHILFAAQVLSGNIAAIDASTGAVINPSFISGAGMPLGIALSNDGKSLYVASQTGTLSSYDTISGALLHSASQVNPFAIAIAADDSVYVTDRAVGGVQKFSKDLSTSSQFIAPTSQGLSRTSGITFDNSGNLWVASYSTGTDNVVKYSATGTFLNTTINTGGTNFGLDVGPDGNLYVALGFVDKVVKLNTTTLTASDFITTSGATAADTRLFPKFLSFEQDCVTYNAPEPGSLISILIASVSGLCFLRRYR